MAQRHRGEDGQMHEGSWTGCVKCNGPGAPRDEALLNEAIRRGMRNEGGSNVSERAP